MTDVAPPNTDINPFQLKRGRLIFSGQAFNPDVSYFVQLDGRSSSGENMRLLDYYLSNETEPLSIPRRLTSIPAITVGSIGRRFSSVFDATLPLAMVDLFRFLNPRRFPRAFAWRQDGQSFGFRPVQAHDHVDWIAGPR